MRLNLSETGAMSGRVMTLLTDFGLRDAYVGILKGVIAQINPAATLIDLTHEIPPQNLLAARFNLLNAYPYFPPGTVHLAIVDPGVGSSRRSIAIQLEDGWLVGPDNGIFAGVLQGRSPLKVVELTNPHYWRVPQPSYTFHGRDIFAPVAAHLTTGIAIEQFGEAIDPRTLCASNVPIYVTQANGLAGVIQYIDRFGNLISNIPNDVILSDRYSVFLDSAVHSQVIPSGRTYSEVRSGEAVALRGSHGWLEIAVNQGNAQQQLGLNWLAPVRIVF